MNKPNTTTSITEKQEALDLLNHLHDTPQVSQRELSNKLSVSLGKINFLIKELSKKGWLKAKKATKSENKLKYIYILTPEGIRQKGVLTKKFLKKKVKEYNNLKGEIEQLKEQLDKS